LLNIIQPVLKQGNVSLVIINIRQAEMQIGEKFPKKSRMPKWKKCIKKLVIINITDRLTWEWIYLGKYYDKRLAKIPNFLSFSTAQYLIAYSMGSNS
jgi:hypothetical protein